jgi:hypothetical protein
MQMILVPALITLVITVLRLVGEMQHWSSSLFNSSAGGGGAIVGISWLIPVFGVYFARKLEGSGEGPSSAGKALGFSFLAFALNTGVAFGTFALKLGPLVIFPIWAVSCAIAVAIAFSGWPALGRTLLAYAFAARIPVAIVMLIAIFGNWGTHYDVAPPDWPQVNSMAPAVKWFWIGFLPQMTIWIYLTVVGGMIFGAITAAIMGRGRVAA